MCFSSNGFTNTSKCPLDLNCAEGSTGILCGACSEGYTYVKTAEKCEPCEAQQSNLVLTIIVVVALLILMVAMYYGVVREVRFITPLV